MIEEVAPDIYKIRLPMPGKLDHINVYLVKAGDQVLLVDTGLATAESWQVLTEDLEKLGVEFGKVTDIFVTHSHPDHMGQLGRIREYALQARFHIHSRELEMVRAVKQQTKANSQEWLLSNGFDPTMLKPSGQMDYPQVPEIRPDDELHQQGDKLMVRNNAAGEVEWEVLWTPGHTPGHAVIVNRQRQLLLSGDHLLGKISSNIGVYPGSSPDPLGDFLNSLERIGELELSWIFPAHGEPFSNYRERIHQLILHHQLRLEKMYSVVEQGPKTAMQVANEIWGDRLVQMEERIGALAETLAHLKWLVLKNKVIQEEMKGFIYYNSI